MEFTYSDYQQTRTKIVEEFSRCQEYYCQTSKPVAEMIEYRKVFDRVQNKRKISQKRLFSIKGQVISVKRRSENQLQATGILPELSESKEPEVEDFFITNNFAQTFLEMSSVTRRTQNKPKMQNITRKRVDTQNSIDEGSQLDMINANVFHQECTKDMLRKQVEELDESSLYLKKQINGIRREAEWKELRKTEAETIYSENKICLINFQRNNAVSRVNFAKTSRMFELNLHGRKKNRNQTNRKNENFLDEVTEKMLKINKFKSKIRKQTEQLRLLDQRKEECEGRLQSYHSLINHYKEVCLINELMPCIQSLSDNIPDKVHAFAHISEEDCISRILAMDIEAVTQSIIDFFAKMKQQGERVESLYLMNLHEKSELSQQLNSLLEFDYWPEGQSFSHLDYHLEGDSLAIRESEQSTMKNFDKKLKHLAINIVSLEDRMKFFARRQYGSLKRIQQTWLRFDKSAAGFIQELERDLASQFSRSPESLSQSESKSCVVNTFQRWEKYGFFLQAIHKNPFIYKYLTKALLVSHLKRIVKTKIKNPAVSTEKLFMAAFHEIQNESLSNCRSKVIKLFSIYEKINKYASKFQVLIVNAKQDEEVFSDEDKENDFRGQCSKNIRIDAKQETKPDNINAQRKRMRKAKLGRSWEDNIQADLHATLQGEFNKVQKLV